jgi:hypothetical protein
MSDAGVLPGHLYSQLNAINDQGVAVGISRHPNLWPTAAVIAFDGRMVALNDLIDDGRSVDVSWASSIDQSNVMVGVARIFGVDRAVLLRPR